MFYLEEVNVNSKEHQLELYKILKKREFNISHKSAPSFEEHQFFVKNNPYRKWYLISSRNKKFIGTSYITSSNVISVNILSPTKILYKQIIEHIISNHRPLKPIKSVRSSYFLINSNPNNKVLQEALIELNFDLIQNTFAYIV